MKYRWLIAGPVAGTILSLAGTAFATWGTNGSGSGQEKATFLGAPTTVNAFPASPTSVTITVTAGPTSPAATGYVVREHGSSTTACTISGATGSCTASGLAPSSSYSFDVYSTLSSWISASSKTTSAANTPPAAPTAVTLANGGGSGGAYINGSNKSGINVTVSLPASSSSSDTVHLTVSDGTNTLTAPTRAGTSGSGTDSFTGLDLHSLTDGTITLTSWVTNTEGTSPSATANYTKDTVAPVTPTSVALMNGGGTGGVYINAANKSSLSYRVVEPSSANDSTTDTVTVALSDGTHTVSGMASGLGSTGGNASVSGIDGSTLSDGTINATATVTDIAGNTSGDVSTSNAKDTIAPSAPTASYSDKSNTTADQITGTAEASASITVTESSPNSNTFRGTANSSNGQYTVNVAAINGSTQNPVSFSYSVTATDAAGNASTATSVSGSDTK